jgi:hypothetical protein
LALALLEQPVQSQPAPLPQVQPGLALQVWRRSERQLA